jgi:hypothetical protein
MAALRLGTTCGGFAVRKDVAKPGRNDAGLSSRATRGIPALRAAQIPRLRLGMTTAAMRLGMTKGDGCERQKVGGVAKIRNARASATACEGASRGGQPAKF